MGEALQGEIWNEILRKQILIMEQEIKKGQVGQEEKKEGQKLTYEQLVAYVQQTSSQAKKVWEENQMLKKALNEAMLSNTFKEIELVIKCLDHAEMFSTSFIEKIIKRLEEVLTPQEQAEKEEDSKEE